MSNPQIDPNRITKPIQLLAAWLAGLVIVNGSLLTTAIALAGSDWLSHALVIAAIGNVPIFLISLFLLQTKFRPEMQEDEYYHRYLENKYSAITGRTEVVEKMLKVSPTADPVEPRTPSRSRTRLPVSPNVRVSINDLLPFYSELRTELEDAGILINKTFGSTSEEPKVPSQFILSFGDDVPLPLIKTALRVCSRRGLHGIANSGTSISRGQLYVGAYSYDKPDKKFLTLTPELIKQLTSEKTTVTEFLKLIPRNEEEA